jgi:phenylpropionate dioxygenase-like ring-hydroxylating dioxygenase large terminal subunit
MHPGLRKFVKPTDLEWYFGEGYSVQKVGIGSDLNSSGSEAYREWQYQVKKTYGSNLPRYGAIWIYIYPNIMIEWYPNVIAISTIYPKSSTSCVNHVELYYRKGLYERNPDYYRAIESVYVETAKEDEEACLLLDEGRRSLYLNQESELGFVDSFLEAGVDHFYQYIHKNL